VDARRLTVAVIVVGLALVWAAGCGGGGGVPPVVETTSVTLAIEWPVQTQVILPTVTRINITVTGAGISPAVQAVIERPATSVTFDVPAGTNRTFRLSGRNSSGQEIQVRETLVEQLQAGAQVNLTVELYDSRDPGDNTRAGATEIGTNGQAVGPCVLDRRALGEANDDAVDWFRFSAQSGWRYEISTREVVSNGTHAIAVFNGDTQLAVADAAANQGATLNWTAPATGTFYVKVWLPQDNTHMTYYLKITSSEPASAAHVNLTVR